MMRASYVDGPKGRGPGRHCEPQAKQSRVAWLPLDCFVASLLARTASVWVLIKETWYYRRASDVFHTAATAWANVTATGPIEYGRALRPFSCSKGAPAKQPAGCLIHIAGLSNAGLRSGDSHDLDHDDFGLNQSKIINVFDSKAARVSVLVKRVLVSRSGGL
jgi:hypothetical protein